MSPSHRKPRRRLIPRFRLGLPGHLDPRRLTRGFPLPLVIGALVLALAVAGGFWWLGGDDATAPASDGSSALPTTAWTRADRSAVGAGGQLRVAVTSLPRNFNPVQADGVGSAAGQILAPTSGSPVRIVEDGGWRVDRHYARAVDVLDRRPLTVRVRLNPDAVWQDGTPIAARDMRSFQRAMSGNVRGLEIASTDGWDDIESVERDGRFEYTVTFERPRADWPLYIYPRLPADVSTNRKRFNNGFRTRAVPSNGPFVVSSIEPKTGTIVQTRNPRWWGPKTRLNRVVWRIAAPSVQAEAFAAGELDAVALDRSTYDRVADEGMVQRASGGTWSHLTLNGGRGPLRDVNVRRAVAAAIDRPALAKTVGDAVKAPARTAGSLVLVPGQGGYRDVAADVLQPGRAEARALLRKAGYRVRDGRAVRKGRPLTLRFPVPSGTPSSAARAAAISRDLGAVGITVRTPKVRAARFFRDAVVPLDFDLVTFTWPASPFPVEAAEKRFRPVDSPQNYTGIAPKNLTGRWRDASRELDDDQRADKIHDLDARLLRQAVMIPLSVLPDVVVVRKGLLNYGAATFEQPDFTRVGWATRP
jgi:peptide/nickel transport system substrate-binding protein